MSPFSVVKDFDVIKDPCPCGLAVNELSPVYVLRLQRAEKALRHCVIPAIPFPAHAANHQVVIEGFPVIFARVLASSVGVMQQPCRRPTPRLCHPKRRKYQLPVDPFAHRPPNHQPGIQVNHYRQVQPAFFCPDVRDVRRPYLVRPFRRELSVEHIPGHRQVVLRVRRHHETPLPSATKLLGAHQLRHPGPTYPHPLGYQLGVHTRASIRLPALLVNRPYLCPEFAVCPRTPRLGPFTPRIKPRPRHLQYPAKYRHRVVCLLRADKHVPYLLSFAKKAVAFFNISRSIKSSRFSFRSLVSSSLSAVVNAPGLPLPESTSACVTQFRMEFSETPRSRATSLTFFPPSMTSFTVSALNSRVNVRLFFCSVFFSISTASHTLEVSFKSGHVHLGIFTPCIASCKGPIPDRF